MAIAKIHNKNYIVDQEFKRITYLDARFYATKDGRFFPSTTTLLEAYPKSYGYYEWLKKVGEDADEIRDEAGRKGSIVHKLTEEYDLGLEINLLNEAGEPICRMSEWAMFEKYVEFRRRFEPTIHEIELNLCSPDLGFGGTLDRVITLNGKKILLDIKTGNSVYNHFWLQQAAYRRLLEEAKPKIKIDDVAILHLNAKTRTNGTKDAVQGFGWQLILRGDEAANDWEVFLATKRLWEAENNDIKPKCFSYSIKHKQP